MTTRVLGDGHDEDEMKRTPSPSPSPPIYLQHVDTDGQQWQCPHQTAMTPLQDKCPVDDDNNNNDAGEG